MKKSNHFKNKYVSEGAHLFFTGITSLLPLSITLYLFYRVFIFIDSISANIITRIFGHKIIGLGFIMTVAFIMTVGYFARNFLGQSILHYVDGVVMRIPIVQIIYSGIKDISNILSKKGKEKFSQAVSVKFPNDDTISIGFLTHESIHISTEERIAVFIPTTPNPTNGFLIFVKPDQIEYLDISIDKAIKMIVSMGAVSPSHIKGKR